MGDINYVQVLFSFMTLVMIVLGSLMNSFEKYLPLFVKQSFRYGKFACNAKDTFVKRIEVPKSWFKHFYIYSSILTTLMLVLVFSTILLNLSVPSFMHATLNAACGSKRYARVSSTATLLAMSLLTLQCWRRLYDTHYVSVFGQNSRMNLSHYLVGFLHYTGAVLAIMAESPIFASSMPRVVMIRWKDLSFVHIAASLLFVWAWWHQYKVAVILANLRRDKKGSVVTQAHKLPQGDWFEYVSSPHILAEILMYLSLTIILWNSITWLYIFAWVISNQVETALLSHWWYEATFANLPKHRKAIIPFVY